MEIIKTTENYIKKVFVGESTGHDYYHALRVRNMATKIAKTEGGNKLVIELASLLHDVIDEKIQNSLNKNLRILIHFLKN